MAFSFGASGKPQASNPNGLTPDGTVVSRVRRRDGQDNSGMMDALIKLFGEMLGKQKPNNTPENLRALRNDPIGDMNKQRDVDVAKVNNQFMEGFGSSLGPTTSGLGMTPEQVARMQGPTAANQWKFPHLFRQPRVFSDPKPNEWVMPGNLGPNKVLPESFPTSPINWAGPKPKSKPFGSDFSTEDAALKFSGDPNFFNLPPGLRNQPGALPPDKLPMQPPKVKKPKGFVMPSFGLGSGAKPSFGFSSRL